MAMAATGGSLLDRVRRIVRTPVTEEPRSPSWAVTLALTVVFVAGAGGAQHLPWIRTEGDARAADQPVGAISDGIAGVMRDGIAGGISGGGVSGPTPIASVGEAD